jgi:hypothetical protein
MENEKAEKLRAIADELERMNAALLNDLPRLLYPNGRQAYVERLEQLDRELMEREFERCQGRSLWDRK